MLVPWRVVFVFFPRISPSFPKALGPGDDLEALDTEGVTGIGIGWVSGTVMKGGGA